MKIDEVMFSKRPEDPAGHDHRPQLSTMLPTYFVLDHEREVPHRFGPYLVNGAANTNVSAFNDPKGRSGRRVPKSKGSCQQQFLLQAAELTGPQFERLIWMACLPHCRSGCQITKASVYQPDSSVFVKVFFPPQLIYEQRFCLASLAAFFSSEDHPT